MKSLVILEKAHHIFCDVYQEGLVLCKGLLLILCPVCRKKSVHNFKHFLFY